MKTKNIELYIHIPFCVKKCLYCDFLSFSVDEDIIGQYIKALMSEIYARKNDDAVVDTIFFGGGTPTLVDDVYIRKIMECIRQSFNISENAEISIEGNPGTITKSKAKAYVEAGINRVSIGLQSANDLELRKLGRIHTYEQFLYSYDVLRNEGISNINIDIMSGLPGQSMDSYTDTLYRVCSLEPEHISAYSLIIEENTPFYDMYGGGNENCEFLSEEEERQEYYTTKEILKNAGYMRYEISNYAKQGYECRHNTGYWERVPYLGLGLGASSLYDGKRFNNTQDMKKYIENASRCDLISENVTRLTEGDSMEEYMFLGLRMMKGVSFSGFYKEFGKSIYDVYGEVIKKYSNAGMMKVNDDALMLTDKGIDVSNVIFADFLL